MKTKTYLKASFREIKQSKGRFIAIVLIIMLGTLLFVGVKTAGPVMQKTMDHYVDQKNLSDLQVISTAGLTEDDLTQAKKSPMRKLRQANRSITQMPKKRSGTDFLVYGYRKTK